MWVPPRSVRLQTLLDVVLLVAFIVGTASLLKVAWPRFTFWGDNAESFLPLWHFFGSELLRGNVVFFDPAGWGGSMMLGEVAYGLLNPLTVLNSIVVGSTDELARAAFFLAVEFLALLGVGVYFLTRSFGGRRYAALFAGIAMPFSGFVVYYEAGNWLTGLMALTGVVWFWWSVRRFVLRRNGPWLPIMFGLLAVTVGNPYAVLGTLVVLFASAVELSARREWRALVELVAVGATIGIGVIATYLPFLSISDGSVRALDAKIDNQNYLTPDLGEFLALSSASYSPRMNAWESSWDPVPSAYLSWLILPIAPWLRWRALSGKRMLSLLVAGGVFALLCLGPQTIWFFHWPIRLLDYTYVAVLVAVAVLLSHGLQRSRPRTRWLLSGTAVLLGFGAAWSSRPDATHVHLLFAVITAVGTALVIIFATSARALPLLAVVLGVTAVIAPLQAWKFAWDRLPVTAEVDQRIPTTLEQIRRHGSAYTGTVLQIANLRAQSGSGAVEDGRLAFGNLLRAAGFDAVNRYTGVGLLEFTLATGLDYRGSAMRDWPLPPLFDRIEPYGVPLVQAMGVDTLVVSSRINGYSTLPRLAPDWSVAHVDDARTILTSPWSDQSGLVVTPSTGVTVVHAEEHGAAVTIETAGAGGTVLLPRLAWPGYSASVDGSALEVRKGAAGLLEVVVPPGRQRIDIEFRLPGEVGMLLCAALVASATGVQQWLYVRRRTSVVPAREDARP